jgi:alkylation response protein AidB-like acyl-CoA dehydrogenase
MLNYMTKAFVPEMAVNLASLCIQLHGGAGYSEDTGIARYLRDAKCNTIGEHATDIHYDFIALHLKLPIDTSFPIFPVD